MWLDNASNIDLLFYSPYADTIVNFARTSELTPLKSTSVKISGCMDTYGTRKHSGSGD